MNDQWLRSLILSAECRSFSKAARMSFISTTALVQQINLFEKELGFSVFVRSNSGLSLTPAGEDFYHTAKNILELYEVGKKRAYDIAKSAKSTVRIGLEPYQFPDQWLSILNDFHSENRDIQIKMVSLKMRDQMSAIVSDRADVSILAEPKEEFLDGLRYLNIYEDTYSFCMSKNHPLAHKTHLTLDDVKDYTIVCGYYPYMKLRFEDGLAGAANIRTITDEYDLSTRFTFLTGDEIFVIHSAWKDQYTSLLAVVETDISAGNVGFVYYKKYEEQVKRLQEFFLLDKYCEAFGVKIV